MVISSALALVAGSPISGARGSRCVLTYTRQACAPAATVVSEEADFVNGLIDKMDQIGDADTFLAEAEAAAKAIRAHVSR